jgi:pimeloyl-ACP methyl ester carboxylesterase
MTQRCNGFVVPVLAILCVCLMVLGCGLLVPELPSGQMPAPTRYDKFVSIEGVRYHYQEFPGPGPATVLLHGFGSSTYTWREVIPHLTDQGFHVWALDMKGFGWSDKPAGAAYDPITLMEEVNAWMAAMGLRETVFVGNSLGGAIGLMLAMAHPERMARLVLIDSGGYPIEKPLIIKIGALPVIRDVAKLFFGRWLIRANLNQVFVHQDRITPARVSAYYDRMRTAGAMDAQIALSSAIGVPSAAGYIERIPELRIPTLIIWGENDTWIPLANGRRFHREIENSQLAVIPECGHVPQEEHPGKTARLISTFTLDGP